MNITSPVKAPCVHCFWLVLLMAVFASTLLYAQEQPAPEQEKEAAPTPTEGELSAVPQKVDVKPVARDAEIRDRIQRVLEATEWFQNPRVKVEESVVFLSGKVASIELRKWAGDLARNTQDVAAVVNRMEVTEGSPWDFSAAWDTVHGMQKKLIKMLPLLVISAVILVLAAFLSVLATRGSFALAQNRVRARLLQLVISRFIGGIVLLVGIYLVLRIAGLTQLALTLVGGTGLIGLILGIAFRDITENFLASIFLSMQRPFESGDLVEIDGVSGYVQRLNLRTTVLMTLDGNIMQVPNATVYKSNICNFTSNSNRREDFTVGIGYDDSISNAQETAMRVLQNHPAVLSDPEPSVLVEALGTSTVNLRVYFWINGKEHSVIKVRSSVIRLVKRAFQEAEISMPDEAREIVFPSGVPVTLLREDQPSKAHARPIPSEPTKELAPEQAEVSTRAEGGLSSEAAVIQEQARQSELTTAGDDLLKPCPEGATAEECDPERAERKTEGSA